jgi:hypothetical protein
MDFWAGAIGNAVIGAIIALFVPFSSLFYPDCDGVLEVDAPTKSAVYAPQAIPQLTTMESS